MNPEQTMFSENGVMVTPARLVVPGQTFAMSGVISVAVVVTNPAKANAIRHIKIGLYLFIFTIPLLLTLWGLIELAMAKPLYNVMLQTPSGEQLVYTSSDEIFIRRIVAAMTDAIVARG